MMDGMSSMMSGWGMGGGWLFMILFWVLVVLAIVAIAKWLIGTAQNSAASNKNALAILQERYARGEIDQQEFEQKKRDLER